MRINLIQLEKIITCHVPWMLTWIINVKHIKILTKILRIEIKRFDNFKDVTFPILYYFRNYTRFCIRLRKNLGLNQQGSKICTRIPLNRSKRKCYFNRYFTIPRERERPRWLSRRLERSRRHRRSNSRGTMAWTRRVN